MASASYALAAGASGPSGTVTPDGAFVVAGIAPGAYRLRVAMPGMRISPSSTADGWSLRSMTSADVDVADQALVVNARQNIEGLVVTFTDRPTDLSGTLTDQANRVAPSYPIIVFSTDRRAWTPGSRRIAEARPSTDGRFRLVGLPPGTYYVCAVVELDESALDDPSFLEQLIPGAVTVTLTDGVKKVQDLKLAGR